jgi:hypothetical protein
LRKGAFCRQCREKIKVEVEKAESKRNCPQCKIELQYKTATICRVAEKKNLLCISCSKKSKNYSGLKRNCPICGTELTYKTSDCATRANKLNDPCKSCSLKGSIPSEQCIKAIKDALTGKKLSEDHIQKIKDANTGLKRTEEVKRKISEAMKRRSFSKETIEKMSNSAKCRSLPSEGTRLKMSDAQYKRYGINNKDEADKRRQLYISGLKNWASRAKRRIPYCEDCGAVEELHAHHIKPKSIFPDLALDDDNAKVLCKVCHIQFHKNNSLYNNET